MTTVYAVLSCAAAFHKGVLGQFEPFLYVHTAALFTMTLFYLFIILYGLKILRAMMKDRPVPLRPYVWAMLKKGPLDKDLYLRALPVFCAVFVFLSVFTNMKSAIPVFAAYERGDMLMAALDRTIHFGVDPWRILHPLMGHVFVTQIVNFFYNLWLPLLFVMLYWQLLSRRDPALRMRFFFTFILSWSINGTLLAILFSSAGPCFYAQTTGTDYYAPLMNYLNGINDQYGLWAVQTQQMLWDSYKDGAIMIGGGISAMPSVHVSTAFLYFLLGRKLGKLWGTVFGLYFALILTGSVHLAWHYAVDGYAAIITTALYWWSSGKIINSLRGSAAAEKSP